MRPRSDRVKRLADVDLSRALGRSEYNKRLTRLQQRLSRIQQAYYGTDRTAVVVFEGWDAAGKGGTIRRIASVLDPRSFKVWPITAPSEVELVRHFLARFVLRLPPNGSMVIFDRSWYGRVLVERVEGLTPEHRWRAAYDEINGFEKLLIDDGTRLVKLFFHISPEAQRRRFESRLMDPHKRWKLTGEDFRNRSMRPQYTEAMDEMLARTSTPEAPWTVIAADDKRYARVAALTAIARRLSQGVDLSPPLIDRDVLEAAAREFGLTRKEIARYVATV